jgi:tetratricopeptide (TPR) repeat protein
MLPNQQQITTVPPVSPLGNPPASWLIFIIAAVSCLVYFNALFNGFVYDDYHQIVENHGLRDLGNLPRVFVEDVWSFMGGGQSNYYRPLMHAMYMLNYALFGLRPWGFHLVNILLHAGVSVLVFLSSCKLLAMSRLQASRALLSFVAALLFATHPIHTEAVTWIACLPELSFSLFYLWSLYAYMGAVQDELLVSRSQYSQALILFVLAALCKETALTLPLMLAVYDYSSARNSYRPLHYIKRYVPFLAVAVLYLAMRSLVLSGFAPLKRHSDLNAYEYFINVFPLFARYLEKLILPLDLKVFYVFKPISSLLTTTGAVALGITLSFAVAAIIAARKNRLVFFNLMIIAVPLLPVLYIPALGDNTFTERYLYLPSFGFVVLAALLIGWLIDRKPQVGKWLPVPVLIVVAFYSAATVQRNMVWKNELSLWLDAVNKEPEGATPHNQLGAAYTDLGDIAKALEQFQIAVRINPEYPDAYANIGLLYYKTNQVDRAIEYFHQALRLKPASPETHNNIGLAYASLGKLDQAVASFQESLRLKSGQPGVYNNLGEVYEKMGLLDQAIEEYRTALRLQADNAEAYNHLGIAFAKKRLVDEALGYFQEALRLDPRNPNYHNNIAKAYAMKGLADKAEEHRKQAQSYR